MNQTHKEKFEAYVRSKCPELKELSFGCWVECEWQKKEKLIGQITRFYLEDGQCDVVDPFNKLWSIDPNKRFTPKIKKIIGHPIQLHHVLKVIGEKDPPPDIVLDAGKVKVYPYTKSKSLVLPLTQPSEWSEETFGQLNKILGI